MIKTLYLGLDPTRYEGVVVHRPVIEVVARPREEIASFLAELPEATHVILTSRSAATILLGHEVSVRGKTIICVGKATAELVEGTTILLAPEAHGEGVVTLLETLELGHVFFPHSSSARDLISKYLHERGVVTTAFPLYDTVPRMQDLSDWQMFEKIVFTSPSTVKVFAEQVGCLPPERFCEAIGPITQQALATMRRSIQIY